MSGHGRTDQLLSPIRIIVRIPEPYAFSDIVYAATRNFITSGKPQYRYWAPVTAATHGFKMVLLPTAAAMRGFEPSEHLCRR